VIYTVKANYGAQKAETTFNYAGGSGSTAPPPPPPPTPVPEPVIEEPEPVIEEPEPIAIVEPEPEPEPEPQPLCGEGTVMKDGKCVVEEKEGGGCLIATAAFGSEMAPQVQFLREIRDNTVMTTQSGTAFMTGFNQFYYSFSPYVADYERENPIFKEAVKVTLTPMLTSLTLLNYVEVDTEEEMLGYGIGIILLNVGMYFVAPAAAIIAIKNRINRN
jgi:Periplasmic protein TonB, links inner and outer membranes